MRFQEQVGIKLSYSQVIIYEATDAQPPAKTSPGDTAGSSGEVIVLFKDFLVPLKNKKGTTVYSLFLSSRANEVLINGLQICMYFALNFCSLFATGEPLRLARNYLKKAQILHQKPLCAL